jgi:hypothetical protein
MSYDHSAPEGANAMGDWLTMMDEHAVQFLVLDARADGELLSLARSRPDWYVDFEDATTVVLARTVPVESVG